MSQVVVVVQMKVQPGRVDEVIAGFTPVVKQTHEEEGCLNYALHRDVSDPDALVLVERWRSQTDLDAHFTQPYMAEMGSLASEFLVEPPNVRFCSPEPIGDGEKGAI